MHLTIFTSLSAEPATIVYIVTGAVGLLFGRRDISGPTAESSSLAESSSFMQFCKKATRERLSRIDLTAPDLT